MHLILGKQGQLGQSFVHALEERGLPYFAPEEEDANILNSAALPALIEKSKAKILINCAAYTDVEKAEVHSKDAMAVNQEAVADLGFVCAQNKALCVHFSTDYVFSGQSYLPYRESDSPAPVNVYGHSKLHGELALAGSGAQYLIFRTSWLYSPYGNNFYSTIRRLGKEKSELQVVMDQIGTPTYAPYLARAVLDILPQFKPEHSGLYHLGDEGVASWYDFAYAIIKQEDLPCHVLPISSADYPTKAKRPSYSVLSKEKVKQVFAVHLPHWTEGVKLCQQAFSKMSS